MRNQITDDSYLQMVQKENAQHRFVISITISFTASFRHHKLAHYSIREKIESMYSLGVIVFFFNFNFITLSTLCVTYNSFMFLSCGLGEG